MRIYSIVICAFIFVVGVTVTQLSAKPHSQISRVISIAKAEALTIDSDEGVICNNEKKICTAKGQVIARKGQLTLYCDRLTAYLKKLGTGKLVISKVEATGNVDMVGALRETASADKAVYDILAGTIKLFGIGKAVLVKKDSDFLRAKDVTVVLKSKNEIDHMLATGEMLFSSPKIVAIADKGSYTPDTRIILLQGNVRVNREEGEIVGEQGEVNLDTGISKMIGIDSSNQLAAENKRVRAVIVPEQVSADLFKHDK